MLTSCLCCGGTDVALGSTEFHQPGHAPLMHHVQVALRGSAGCCCIACETEQAAIGECPIFRGYNVEVSFLNRMGNRGRTRRMSWASNEV